MSDISGSQAIVQCLLEEGVNTIFGYPGGAVIDLYDELMQCQDLTHVLVRHEQAAVHAADGYARVTGEVGVALKAFHAHKVGQRFTRATLLDEQSSDGVISVYAVRL